LQPKYIGTEFWLVLDLLLFTHRIPDDGLGDFDIRACQIFFFVKSRYLVAIFLDELVQALNGGIECALHTVMFNQVWRKYGIPLSSANHGPSSSKRIDFQCGYEKAMGALTAALDGGHFIGFHGGVYGEIAFHPAQAVLDDDTAGMVGRFLEGA
jgi:hypothetical protein